MTQSARSSFDRRSSVRSRVGLTPHREITVKIPLNDDDEEKASRLHSRTPLQNRRLSNLKSSSQSPKRRRESRRLTGNMEPSTPGEESSDRRDEHFGEPLSRVSSSVTPKKVPIRANFEEWMRLATDNKITAVNSWNFALIDYFHDLSLLIEGDTINFQKASYTLDGCVKIYANRVDSVATDVGKLLNGLQARGNGLDSDENEDGENGEENEEGNTRRNRGRAQRSTEATLAPSDIALRIKKYDLEFTVDPLFTQGAASLDEGGSAALLLSRLSSNKVARMAFDSIDESTETADDQEDTAWRGTVRIQEMTRSRATTPTTPTLGNEQESRESTPASEEQEHAEPTNENGPGIDYLSHMAIFFADMAKFREQSLCETTKGCNTGDAPVTGQASVYDAFRQWADENNDSSNGLGDQTGVMVDEEDDAVAGFSDDDSAQGNFNLPLDTSFGDGGEAWAREAAMEPQLRVYNAEGEDRTADDDETNPTEDDPDREKTPFTFAVNRNSTEGPHDGLLSYFDNTLHKNWAGPEHWKVRRIKDSVKQTTTTTRTRKEKEPFQIDFNSPMSQTTFNALHTFASSDAVISLPLSKRNQGHLNNLPEDRHFDSKQLLRLFLMPKAKFHARNLRRALTHNPDGTLINPDEAPPDGQVSHEYWANNFNEPGVDGDKTPLGNYNADFFTDDPAAFAGGVASDDEVFVDAAEGFVPPADDADAVGTSTPPAIAESVAQVTQAFTQNRRLRPNYVQYARVAKKVDVRRLKEELWKCIGWDEDPRAQLADGTASEPVLFSKLVQQLQKVYPVHLMADISTSYSFICLLHLANEKKLYIESNEAMSDLLIWRDTSIGPEDE